MKIKKHGDLVLAKGVVPLAPEWFRMGLEVELRLDLGFESFGLGVGAGDVGLNLELGLELEFALGLGWISNPNSDLLLKRSGAMVGTGAGNG